MSLVFSTKALICIGSEKVMGTQTHTYMCKSADKFCICIILTSPIFSFFITHSSAVPSLDF